MATKNSTFINDNAPAVDDIWLNMTQSERNGIITSSDQTISTVDGNQCQKGISNLSHWANFYTDGGAANAYVLSVQSPTTAPTKYKTGMELGFRATNSNTGASTVNAASLGVKKIFKQDGTTALSANDINTLNDTRLRYDESLDAAAGAFIIVSGTPTVFSATMSSTQVIASGPTDVKVQFNSEVKDSDGNYDPTTNYRFTASQAGSYQINGSLNYINIDDGELGDIRIFKNGSAIFFSNVYSAINANPGLIVRISAISELAVGDYLEIFARHTHSPSITLAASSTDNYFQGFLIK